MKMQKIIKSLKIIKLKITYGVIKIRTSLHSKKYLTFKKKIKIMNPKTKKIVSIKIHKLWMKIRILIIHF